MHIDLSDLTGLRARGYRGPDDHPGMVSVINAWNDAVGIEEVHTVEEMDTNYARLQRCDPERDILIVEDGSGTTVGYTRVTWWQVEDGPRCYATFANVAPVHGDSGLYGRIIDWSIARGAEVAAGHDIDCEKVHEAWAEEDREPTKVKALVERGFETVTWGATLVRPHLDDIPDHSLPDGLEIRPVEESHLRAIFDADDEAFRDHWGYSPHTEEDFQRFLEFPHMDTTLWKIAWDGDRVAGQVKSFVNREENEKFGRLRGWTEFISTGREWRRQGVARALIVESLRELRDRGLTEAALGVHTENPNGAFELYTALGYEQVTLHTTMRRLVG